MHQVVNSCGVRGRKHSGIVQLKKNNQRQEHHAFLLLTSLVCRSDDVRVQVASSWIESESTLLVSLWAAAWSTKVKHEGHRCLERARQIWQGLSQGRDLRDLQRSRNLFFIFKPWIRWENNRHSEGPGPWVKNKLLMCVNRRLNLNYEQNFTLNPNQDVTQNHMWMDHQN